MIWCLVCWPLSAPRAAQPVPAVVTAWCLLSAMPYGFSLLFPPTTNTSKSLMLEARSEHKVKPSHGWGMLPWRASLQREMCRIQASKGCADAQTVLRAEVVYLQSGLVGAWSLNSLPSKVRITRRASLVCFLHVWCSAMQIQGEGKKIPTERFLYTEVPLPSPVSF